MKKISLLLLLMFSITVFSQETGKIKGVITNEVGAALEAVDVYIDGTDYFTTTNVNGQYELTTNTGEYTISFSIYGYEDAQKIVSIAANDELDLSIQLTPIAAANNSVTQLEQASIVGNSNKESEASTLNVQKKSIEIKEVKGAEELARTGVSDAQSAFTKVSNITTLEGSQNVFVRGLGDRYNYTSLNEMPLPSNDPEYKNIALNLFSTDIIASVDVSKTFLAKQNGDVAGASLNINTKEFFGKPYLQLDLSSGLNTRSLGEDFILPAGANWFGVAKNTKPYVTNLNEWQFKTSSNPEDRGLPINSSLRLSGGKKFDLGSSKKLAWYAVASYDSNYNYLSGIEKTINNRGSYFNDYTTRQFTYNTSKLVMSNLVLSLSLKNKIKLNNAVILNNKQDYFDYSGQKNDVSEEEEGEKAYLVRQQQSQNLLYINQLLADLTFGEYTLDLGVSYNMIKADEPDRKSNLFVYKESENKYLVATGSQSYNNRYFHNLDENDLSAKAVISRKLFNDNLNLTLGYNYRNTDRNFEAIQYNFDFPQPVAIDINNLGGLFNSTSVQNGIFDIETYRGSVTNALDPQFYTGNRTIHSAFTNLDWELGKVLVTLGVRADNVNQDIEWNTSLSNSSTSSNKEKGDIKETLILPSLNVKYSINRDNILRFAASKTYNVPQFKETAPFVYERITEVTIGNPDLEIANVYNADIKWELYPKKGELISITAFGKYIENPINKFAVPSAADQLSYANAESAIVAGAEVELKKSILNTESSKNSYELNYGINASYLYTKQKNGDAAQFTNKESQMEGASPFILNTDLSLIIKNLSNKNKETVASIVFNYAHDKIYALGVQENEDIIEKAFPTLDFVLSKQFNEKFGLKLSVKNILDSTYERTKEVFPNDTATNVIVRSYQRGIDFNLGLNYKF